MKFIYNRNVKSIQKNNKQTIIKSWGILFTTIVCIFLSFYGLKNFYFKILFLACILIFFLGSLIFWLTFIPFISWQPSKSFKVIHSMIGKNLFNHGTFFRVENGYFDKDYFTLSNKPSIAALLIDRHSAVVIQKKQKEKSILLSGFHQPSKGTKVVHSINLQPTQFIWGPETSRNPFRKPNNTNLDLTHKNSYAIAYALTKCKTANGISLAPVFAIIYTIQPVGSNEQLNEKLLTLSRSLEQKGLYGNVSQNFSEIIGGFVSRQFRLVINEHDFSDVYPSKSLPSDMFLSIKNKIGQMDFTANQSAQSTDPLESALFSLITIKVYLEKIWVE